MIEMRELLAKHKAIRDYKEGSIVKGTILEIRPREVLVDIGYKSEGAIAAHEFDDIADLEVGDEVEVLICRLENDEGMVILSKERAAAKQNWEKIVKVFDEGGLIKGKVKAVVKGGLLVNVGVEAFLPGSQIDVIPPKDLTQFVGNTYDFKIVKLNDDRRNVVLSRREIIEAERSEKRGSFMASKKPGDVVKGVVKNITDFGAFVDLDGMDGLLHITDITWGRLNHPSEVLKVGMELDVVILEINKDKERVSLGLKQNLKNPWDKIEERFAVGAKVKGKVTNLMPYGAFIELEEGVEGLIHVSELSWTKRIARPSDVLVMGQEIEAIVLGVNKDEQKISLGVRQLDTNPWDEMEHKYPIGKTVKGTVRNMTAYGAFVELEEGVDGMVHVSDMSWTRKINHPSEMLKKGDEVEAVVIDIDKNAQRISLGMKQMEDDPWKDIEQRFKIGDKVKGKVGKIAAFGAFVELDGGIDGLVHISQISEDRIEKVKDVLKVGQELEARVIKVDKAERRIGLSIKAANYNDEDMRKEAAAFETAIKPGEDLVGLDKAFATALEDYRPGEPKKK
ncbi:30S ribosomal protein S1 [Verrucomicrobiota bacterium]|jgi:small subunit ribosomal protein S1|nr:30S ribosomal protein S1 [Verrucomicrobiota bacterium]GDX10750.1 30S ribosomal protein S1 [Verrucomicrobiota bacterium]